MVKRAADEPTDAGSKSAVKRQVNKKAVNAALQTLQTCKRLCFAASETDGRTDGPSLLSEGPAVSVTP